MVNMACPCLGEEEKEAIGKIIDSGMIACGNITTEFENRFSAYVGVKHGIGTTSGTTALEVAIKALGLGQGDKILTTAYSFIASTNAILYAGATPIFADIKEESFNIDPQDIDRIVSKNPDIKALLIVHLFGKACDMDRIMELVKKHHLLLIEDCAQAHGCKWKGRTVGTFGDVAAYSFYPTKNMTTGEGGMVLTSNDDVAERARMLINHGMKIRYHHEIVGYNYRMTNLAASIGLCQLEKLKQMNKARQEHAKVYDEGISNTKIILPKKDQGHVYHQYTIRVVDELRNNFIRYLDQNQIGYGVFYPLTIPEQKCYENFAFLKNYLHADIIKEQVVSIPVHPKLKREELDYVVEKINKFEV